MKGLKGLDNMKSELETRVAYTSNFDFESFEIKEEDKDFLIKREKKLIESGKKYNESLYEICKALYEVSDKLKDHKQGTFMGWYRSIGLNKDKVSELLKRWSLYDEREDLIPYISGLSGLAIRMLTHKNTTPEMRKLVYEGEYTASNDIKKLLLLEENREENPNDHVLIPVEFANEYKNFTKNVRKIDLTKLKETDIEKIHKLIEKFNKIIGD